MGLKKSVFGSKSEEIYFSRIIERWGTRCEIYHNLPYANVFEFQVGENVGSNGKSITLSASEREYLLKPSIDFVLCADTNKPLMCIEYNGMQEGFSVGARYQPSQKSHDEKRTWKLTTKLEVADAYAFFYVVLSSRHFQSVPDDMQVSIVDAIIGEWLVYQTLVTEVKNKFSPKKLLFLARNQYNALDDAGKEECLRHRLLRYFAPRRMVDQLTSLSEIHKLLRDTSLALGNTIDLMAGESFVFYLDHRKMQSFPIGHTVSNSPDFGDAALYGEKWKVWHQGFEAEREAWIPIHRLSGFWGFDILTRDLARLVTLQSLKAKLKQLYNSSCYLWIFRNSIKV